MTASDRPKDIDFLEQGQSQTIKFSAMFPNKGLFLMQSADLTINSSLPILVNMQYAKSKQEDIQ